MAEPADVPQPNLDETEEALGHLPHASVEHLVLIQEGRGAQTKTFRRDRLAEAHGWLADKQGRQNCYFHVNILRADLQDWKAKRSDVVAVRMLHVDLDEADGRARLEAFPVKPTWVVHSGGGHQGFWFLRQPSTELDRAENLNQQIAKFLGGDHCHNLDRVMRLPGTLNVPNAKKRAAGRWVTVASTVVELTDYSRAYGLEEIETALANTGQALLAGGQLSCVNLAEIAEHIPPFVLGLIEHGDDLEHPMGSESASYPSRSEVLFRVACELVRAKLSEVAIVSIFTNPAYKIADSVLEKGDPGSYARRQAAQAARAIGDGWPTVSSAGTPKAGYANALTALMRLNVRLEKDLFRNRLRANGHVIEELVGDLTDDVCMILRHAVLERWGFDPGSQHIFDAAHTLALHNKTHPIREYLARLVWDGVPRLNDWLSTYLGAEQTRLSAAIGQLVLLAAVRRVRQPGVKFDSIMVLEGPQGSGKSTAVRILAGDENFSDQDILTLNPKEQMEILDGVWLYEISELQGLKKADVGKVKAFASRQVDRARLAYARFPSVIKRQVIFIGTTNDDQYLTDPTGNRRFWPIRTNEIDLPGLRDARDQLWAEAAHLEATGVPLVLPRDLWPTAAEEQAARVLDDPWFDGVASARGTIEGGVERITTTVLLQHLGVPIERQGQYDAKRIVPMMRKAGWEGPKNGRIQGKVVKCYQRSAEGKPDDPTY
jgi:hypothetical protein